MKIAINTLGPSRIKVGIGNYIVNLVNGLQNLDKNNRYLIFVAEKNKDMFEKAENFRFRKIGFFSGNRILRIVWEQIILPFTLLINKVDVLHSPGFVSPIFKTTKQILTIHDMTFFTHPQFHLKSKIRYFQKMIPVSAKKADMLVVDSENTKQDIINILKINPEKIKTVYLGTNFKKQTKAKEWITQKYGIIAPFILFAGMLEPRKNIPNLIRAFAGLAPEISHSLVIVGKNGWVFEEIFELVERLNLKERIIFTGYIPDDDLQYFYSAADCFVYPSYYEGFGIPVIEAMACGCPVITSNNSSLKEIAGDAALLINNPDNASEIAKKIKKIILNKRLRETLNQKGLKKIKEFSWKKTAEKTLEAYKCA